MKKYSRVIQGICFSIWIVAFFVRHQIGDYYNWIAGIAIGIAVAMIIINKETLIEINIETNDKK